ncbi:protein kinase [Streptomyces sp. NPDC059875]|uniref:serine/threonine-protein kinase n=1 Tax=unclassified Streptomyces TaxID=2593676 RepID=UPI00364BC008
MSSGENERLAGRYRVVRQLGRGGMGVVWRAVDEVLGREVAVKELRTYNDSSGPELADLRLRMQREARAAARVRHPGVIAVHDVTDHQGRPVIVMELIDGPSLDDVLSERGVLEPREAAAIGAAVLEALAAAHDVGVLHRDVKPGNVLLDKGGRVVLTDFGIATMDDPGDGSSTHLTRSGEIVGSLDYLAPERAQGQQPGPASDVWALGATLYAAVEGASPFRRTSTWSTLNAIVVDPLPEPHRAGPLGPVLRQLLDKDPTRRPDARSAARLLTAVAEGGRDSAAPTHPGVPTERNATPPRPEGFGAAGSGPEGFGPAAGHPAHGAGAAPSPDGFGSAAAHPSQEAAAAAAQSGGFGPAAQQPAHGAAPAVGQPEGFGPAAPQSGGFGPAAPHRAPGAPHPAGGYASAAYRPDGSGPGVPQAAPAGGFPVAGYATAGVPTPPTALPPGRKRSTPLVAAAVAAVLLVGGGVTYALIDRGGASGQEQLAGGQAPSSPAADPGRVIDPGSAGATTSSATPSKAGSTKPATPSSSGTSKAPRPGPGGTDGGGTAAGGSASGGGTTSTGGGGTSGAGTSGSSTTTTGGGGSTPQPAPVCHSRGDGKYDCQVWRTEKTYSDAGAEMGILNAGTNYFYCQVNLGRRETHGEWTNVWWARTDDDSGNRNVYFSVVYIKGGDNDGPLPGLPVC